MGKAMRWWGERWWVLFPWGRACVDVGGGTLGGLRVEDMAMSRVARAPSTNHQMHSSIE